MGVCWEGISCKNLAHAGVRVGVYGGTWRHERGKYTKAHDESIPKNKSVPQGSEWMGESTSNLAYLILTQGLV